MTDPNHPQPVPPALDCWYLTGPTAAGKTAVGVELARQIQAEIVSLDSMALYQGMDIGTAKPAAEDRRRVPHHLLDLVPPTEDFSLSEYIDAAHAAIADIRSRGKQVLFVGGTPLYLKALLRGVYQGPPADWQFRTEIEAELKTLPVAALHQRLEVIDPLLAAKLHPHDKRRIIRGLEVFRLTGKRLSHLQTQFDDSQPAARLKVFVLSWPREALHLRIDARVEQMFAAGLVEEVRGLLGKHGRLSRTARQAVGYGEVVELLEGQGVSGAGLGAVGSALRGVPGSASTPPPELAACIEQVKIRTRQFARRQETWFRSLRECRLVPMLEGPTPAAVAQTILDLS
ncbi:MAG: tRNA (adenosine(37)-N6)-dimethylallyltransferase MiaA [Pirellulaceae bacterium]